MSDQPSDAALRALATRIVKRIALDAFSMTPDAEREVQALVELELLAERPPVLTHADGKDLYAEGVQVGLELGRKMPPPDMVRDAEITERALRAEALVAQQAERIATLEAQNRALREALEEHGYHSSLCRTIIDTDCDVAWCDCGLRAALFPSVSGAPEKAEDS